MEALERNQYSDEGSSKAVLDENSVANERHVFFAGLF
jgi:hypothetical protein